MNFLAIINFISPNFGDSIQTIFFSIMFLMLIGVVFATHIYAQPNMWEKKWNRGGKDKTNDHLDIEHGSVTDLWYAVATAPEKIAEIMPGMLLVVGLLGTFLGLGLALNMASGILAIDATNTGAAADSMNQLMGMLQGLGTKFKTSTWGILGFIVIKIWHEFFRFDEKRMTWVISKVKFELEERKRNEALESIELRKEILNSISSAANKIADGIRNNALSMKLAIEEQEKSILKSRNSTHKELCENLEKIGSDIAEGFNKVQHETRHVGDAMREFTDNTQTAVREMSDVAQKMSDGITHIDTAASRMAKGAEMVGKASDGLNSAIDDFSEKFTEVLNRVRNDLSHAIENMSQQASQTLEQGSTRLSDATQEISAALGQLSQDVNGTMTEVKGSIQKALDIQKRAAGEFTISAQTLNQNVEVTSGAINKLAGPIEEGLRAISASNRQVVKVGNSMESAASKIQSLIDSLSVSEPSDNMAEKEDHER